MYKVKKNNIIKLKKFLEKNDEICSLKYYEDREVMKKKYFKISKKHKNKPMPTSKIVMASPQNKFLITQLQYNGSYDILFS